MLKIRLRGQPPELYQNAAIVDCTRLIFVKAREELCLANLVVTCGLL